MYKLLVLGCALALAGCAHRVDSNNRMIAEGDRNPTIRMGESHAGGAMP